MGMEYKFGKMIVAMKVSFKITSIMDTALSIIQMETSTSETGKMTASMDKANIPAIMDISTRDNGF